MAFNRVVINSALPASQLAKYIRPQVKNSRASIRRIGDLLFGFAKGALKFTSVELCTGAVRAVGTITFTDQPVAAETLIVGGITFTARASGAVANEWNLTSGGTAAADAAGNAASVAALINDHATLGACMTAVQVLGVVTVTIDVPGVLGNTVVIAEGAGGLTNATVSTFATGSEGTKTTLGV
jgi:hypothetical protein